MKGEDLNMDEAKSLVHMAVTTIFSSMFLYAAVGLISVGLILWAAFSKQDAANQRMENYANYTSYDNTTVRGQEVVQLLESDLDVFVLIYDGTNPVSGDINNMSVGDLRAVYYPDVTGVKDFDLTKIDASNSNVTCKNALTKTKSLLGTPEELGGEPGANQLNLNSYSYSALIKAFTTSNDTWTQRGENGVMLGKLTKDATNTLIESGSYAAFKSVLVYAETGTTDVAGVILVREALDVTVY